MSMKIEIPSYLRSYTDDTEIVEVNEGTIGECISQLIAQFPDIEKMLFNKSGKLHGYVGIYVNGEDAYPEDLAKPVEDGDNILLLYMIGGG